jgi:hypothetical protein
MKQTIFGFSTTCLLAVALLNIPSGLIGQTTNKAPAGKTVSGKTSDTEKAVKAGPFHGKLAAVDKVAKTITVGKRTFLITSESKLKKAGKPATLDEGVVGDNVSGYVKPNPDGKLVATTINFGAKTTTDSGEKPKSTPAKDQK